MESASLHFFFLFACLLDSRTRNIPRTRTHGEEEDGGRLWIAPRKGKRDYSINPSVLAAPGLHDPAVRQTFQASRRRPLAVVHLAASEFTHPVGRSPASHYLTLPATPLPPYSAFFSHVPSFLMQRARGPGHQCAPRSAMS